MPRLLTMWMLLSVSSVILSMAVIAGMAGADGLVSVGSNVLPGAFRTLCDLARAGNHAAAEAWDARLQPYHDFFTLESNPIPVKALLQRLGIGHGLRLPLLPLAGEYEQQADLLLKAIPALEEQSVRESIAA